MMAAVGPLVGCASGSPCAWRKAEGLTFPRGASAFPDLFARHPEYRQICRNPGQMRSRDMGRDDCPGLTTSRSSLPLHCSIGPDNEREPSILHRARCHVGGCAVRQEFRVLGGAGRLAHSSGRSVAAAAAAGSGDSVRAGADGPVLVTVLGKGGAGKTTAAVLLAQFYAASGNRTCLLLQSEDRYAEELLGCAVSSKEITAIPEKAVSGNSTASNLCAFRLDTTQFLLEPLEVAKEVDQRLGLTQGALAEVVGEELSVLPGMDAFTAIAAIELLAKPGGGLLASLAKRRRKAKSPGGGAGGGGFLSRFPWGDSDADVVVFDAASSSDVLRLLASPERARWYLRRFRSVAESTDAGRVAMPSIARALESELGLVGDTGSAARNSAEVWAKLDDVISVAVNNIANPKKVKVFLVTPAEDEPAIRAAKRLWGCTLQAGACVSSLLYHRASGHDPETAAPPPEVTAVFKDLPLAPLPATSSSSISSSSSVLGFSGQLHDVLLGKETDKIRKPVTIDLGSSTVYIFLPGFEKADVKLKQWKGGSQLLVEAGDQRRCIDLPRQMWGKITGAKFVDYCLEVKTK